MQHGGPFPATTDSRFTSVGPDGIRRFARPISFQNWSNELLPDELKDGNPLGIWRMVDNEFKKESILLISRYANVRMITDFLLIRTFAH